MKQKDKKPALKIALGQIDVQAGRPDINSQRVIDESIAASKRGVQVIVFPEMCISGYLIGDWFNSNAFAEDVERHNKRVVEALADYDVVVIFGTFGVDKDKKNENGSYRKCNAAFVAQKGKLIANDADLPYAIKSLHPNYRIFDDSRYFYDLRKLAMERKKKLKDLLAPFTVVINGHEYKLGVMLCEDMWDIDYAQKPARVLKKNGADILINLSCSNWSWRKNAKRHQVIRDLIAKVKLPFVYVNSVGCQNNGKNFIPFDGSSTIYNVHGEIVAICDMYQDIVKDILLSNALPPITPVDRDDVEEMFLAIKEDTLGFLRSSSVRHSGKVIIGLSGGADSMLSAAFFVHLLGPDRVILVNMPVNGYNSPKTIALAQKGADNLGVPLRMVPIDEMVWAEARATGIEEGTAQFKTLMATVRFQVLKSIAALEGAIIINNGNKTELAFGYATLNGDMRGYFAPWMDALKGEVYQLADYMNRRIFKCEVIPAEIIYKDDADHLAPMDELTKDGKGNREDPFDYGRMQSDRSFEVGYHDAMIRSFMELRKEPEWFLAAYKKATLEETMLLPEGTVRKLFPTAESFVDDLEQKYKMFQAGIHKRVQSIPGAHFSRSSFGWDFREFMPVMASYDLSEDLPVYYTQAYYELKDRLLRKRRGGVDELEL